MWQRHWAESKCSATAAQNEELNNNGPHWGQYPNPGMPDEIKKEMEQERRFFGESQTVHVPGDAEVATLNPLAFGGATSGARSGVPGSDFTLTALRVVIATVGR